MMFTWSFGLRLREFIVLSAVVTLVLGLMGCGPNKPLEGQLLGVVTYQGQPVTNMEVVFEMPSEGIGVATLTDTEGKFIVANLLPVGTYRVAVRPPDEVPPPPDAKTPQKKKERPRLPQKSLQTTTSGLTITVVEGENDVKLELKD